MFKLKITKIRSAMYACLPLFSDAVFVNLSSNKRGTWDGERGIKILKKKKRLRGLLQCPAAAKPVSFLNISKRISQM